jgi:DNA-binding SARP family transcriptional activator
VEFQVLGSVDVRIGPRPAKLGRRACDLLAILICLSNRPLTGGVLADHLWAGEPPRTAASALRVHLAAIRAATRRGPDHPSRLATTPRGYVLTVEPGELDASRFEHALREGTRAGVAPARAVEILRAGLGEWTGSPYEGVDDVEPILAHREYLSLRLTQLQIALAHAELALGRYQQVAAESARWLRERPTSEELATVHVRATMLSGDQASALRAHRRFARHLREEFGLEPSDGFRAVEHELLVGVPGDPSQDRGRQRVATRAPGRGLAERADAIAAVEEAWGSRPSIVVVRGVAGMGKSTWRVRAGRRTSWPGRSSRERSTRTTTSAPSPPRSCRRSRCPMSGPC